MRVLTALLWLRWREARHSLRLGGRRDALERLSRAFAVALPVIVVLFMLPGMIAVAGGGFLLGRAMAQAGTANLGEGIATFGLRIGLMFWVLVLIVTPAVRSASGGRDERRFQLLPVRHGVLHRARVLARAADPGVLLVLPGLVGLPAGLAAGGAAAAAAVTALAGAGLLLFVLAWGHCVSLAVAALFRDRRRAEWTLVVVAAGFAAGATLVGLVDPETRRVELRASERAESGASRLDTVLDAKMPRALRWLPSEAYVRALAEAVGRQGSRGGAGLALLFAFAAVPYLASSRLGLRLTEQPAASGGRRSAAGGHEPAVPDVPGLSPSVGAVAWFEARAFLRTVRGKTGVWLNVPILGCLYFLVRVRLAPELPASFREVLGVWVGTGTCAVTAVSLQPILVNQFAALRTGWVLEALAPLTVREIVRGKLAATAGLYAAATLPCLALAVAMFPAEPVLLWLSVLPTAVALFSVVGPAGLLIGAVFPRAADLNRLGRDGNPHGLAALVATLGSFAAAGAVAAAWFVPWLVWRSPAAALAASVVCAAAGLALGWFLLRFAEPVVDARIENLVLTATRT